MEGLQNDLERYKKQYFQTQQECQKLTTLNDDFRGERMTLLRQLKEAKHDCDTLSKLLEDQEQSLHIEDRERLLGESEKRF